MTPWEVLGIAEGESDPEVVRAAFEKRLERFGDIGEARSWIESAYELLKADPSGADPYGLLEDPWGKWNEILASRPDPAAERPPHRFAVPEPEPAPEPEPETMPREVTPARRRDDAQSRPGPAMGSAGADLLRSRLGHPAAGRSPAGPRPRPRPCRRRGDGSARRRRRAPR